MRRLIAICIYVALVGCASHSSVAEFARFENPDGDVVLLTRDMAIIRGQIYRGLDCSNESMYCVDYSGYFSIIAPKRCQDIWGDSWKVGELVATPLGEDHHHSQSMYGVNRGEMIAYSYSWDGHGIVGLTFDSLHKVGNREALNAMGYRDSSIFYEKASGADFLACESR